MTTENFPGGLAQVVPALPPAVNGLGDYAAALAQALEADATRLGFIVAGRVAKPGRHDAAYPTPRREPAALVEAADGTRAECLVVHFVGYAYARWGLCFWLAEGLARWRVAHRQRRLVTIFHELYATGPVWRTSFWTAVPQRRIARRIAAISDAMVATSHVSAARLQAWQPDKRVETMPVFSNVGELEQPSPLARRAPVAVVFGGGRRQRTWDALQASSAVVGDALLAAGVEQVLDIGPPLPIVPNRLAGLPVNRLGALPPAELSHRLADARIGLVDYPHHVFTKSGIAAAYLAHGVLCLNTSTTGELPPDLAEGREFVHPARLAGAGVDAEAVAAAGHRWYRGHDLAATAALVHELIT